MWQSWWCPSQLFISFMNYASTVFFHKCLSVAVGWWLHSQIALTTCCYSVHFSTYGTVYATTLCESKLSTAQLPSRFRRDSLPYGRGYRKKQTACIPIKNSISTRLHCMDVGDSPYNLAYIPPYFTTIFWMVSSTIWYIFRYKTLKVNFSKKHSFLCYGRSVEF